MNRAVLIFAGMVMLASATPSAAGVCKGDDPCKQCKDCSACKYCHPKNAKGGSCGTCRDQSGEQRRKSNDRRDKSRRS